MTSSAKPYERRTTLTEHHIENQLISYKYEKLKPNKIYNNIPPEEVQKT